MIPSRGLRLLAVGAAIVQFGLAFFVGIAAAAETGPDPFPSERPARTADTALAPPGRIVVEGGGVFDTGGPGNTLRLPGVLLRAGLGRRLEVRLALPAWIVRSNDGMAGVRRNGGESGNLPVGRRAYEQTPSFSLRASPLALGAKTVLLIGRAFTVGLLPVLFVPVSGAGMADSGVSYETRLLLSRHLTSRTKLAFNGAFAFEALGAESRSPELVFGASARATVDLSTRYRSFVELAVRVEELSAPGPDLNGGVVARVSESWKLDFHLGLGLAALRHWRDVVLGFGIAAII